MINFTQSQLVIRQLKLQKAASSEEREKGFEKVMCSKLIDNFVFNNIYLHLEIVEFENIF